MHLLRGLLGAFALGFGMIFGSRAHDQHWSESITVLAVEERSDDDAAGPE